jgi:hypothetical protein
MSGQRDPAGELVLASLYVTPDGERTAELRRAAAGPVDWERALVALEAHGVLGLALRNLLRAGAEVPPAALERLKERDRVLGAVGLGFRLTLERFLEAAARDWIEVTLLKGASLALDLYPRGLRSQGDLDLLVRPDQVLAAVAAARRIGLAPPSSALPVWWYRLAHFHLKLEPADGLQREIELHWHLHPSSRLHGVRLADLLARRRPVELAGLAAWTLDPLDRLLHLVTHLVRHSPPNALDRATLSAWAADPRAPLRMKWLLDVRAEVETRHTTLDVDELARRAAEWNAGAELALVLAWIELRLGFAEAARSWVARVLTALPQGSEPAAFTGVAHDRALAGFDLRPSALRALPRWVWPPAKALVRPSSNGAVPLQRRLGHAARVLAHVGLVLLATPFAWLARLARNLARRGAPPELGPEDWLDLAGRARRIERIGDRPSPS